MCQLGWWLIRPVCAPQDAIVCLFMASNLYAIGGCRWFSPSVVVLGQCTALAEFLLADAPGSCRG